MATRNDDAAIAAAKQQLAEALPLAVSTIKELAALGEKESVRLAAAATILDRVGVTKPQTVTVVVDQSEHDRAKREAEAVIARLDKNRAALDTPRPSLEAIIVHEGVGEDDELPVAVEYPDAIDAGSTTTT